MDANWGNNLPRYADFVGNFQITGNPHMCIYREIAQVAPNRFMGRLLFYLTAGILGDFWLDPICNYHGSSSRWRPRGGYVPAPR